jgi:formylglycine-generating enzyme required for sulfatase activity
MIHLFIYLAEVSICLILLYMCYVLLINNDTFYKFKRFYLLLSVIISITIPQLPSLHFSKDVDQKTAAFKVIERDNSNLKETFGEVVFGNFPVKPDNIDSTPRLNGLLVMLMIVYILGVLFLICKLIISIIILLRLSGSNNIEPYGKYTLVHHNGDYPTFSFLRYIFLNSANLNSRDMITVLRHEEVHIERWHSIDMIFIELNKVVFWFNPVIWSFKRELIKVHECEVDDYLIDTRQEDISNYQILLLKQYLSKINIELAHPFNYSLVKYRIEMMTKTKSGHRAKYKIVFALPVIIFCLLAFSNANLRLSKVEFTEMANSARLWEPEPNGMAYIPGGSFVLKRTDGNITKNFEVTLDPFWMNQTEVSVKQYFEYIESVKRDSVKQYYEKALPNSEKVPYKDYFLNKKYADFPVVGISLQQAINYCKWLTSSLNQKLKSKGKPPVLEFRIPTEVEWVYASFGGKNPNEIANTKPGGLFKVSANKPNDWGLYNMISNVSEWTYTLFDPGKYMTELQNSPDPLTDKIVVRGDNYKNSVLNDKVILNGSESFDYVGFRYVRTYLGQKYGKVQ